MKKEKKCVDFDRERLRALLLSKNLNHQQFGDAIGVSKQFIGSILSGRHRPSLELLIKIINKFELPGDFFFTLQ